MAPRKRPVPPVMTKLPAKWMRPLASGGAILLTGYLGGAVASHLRLSDPLFSHTLFGVYLGIALWGGLWLRDARIRNLLPIS